MRYLACYLFALLGAFTPRAMAQSADTYEIEALTPPTSTIRETSKSKAYDRIGAEVEAGSYKGDSLISFDEHPFLTGALRAYQEHRPFVISPDMVWLLISQGFARHINQNPGKFRNKLVGFADRKKLVVVVDNIRLGDPDADWAQVFPEFSRQIAQFTGSELTDALTCDFSTSTPATRIASQITLMESMKSYFDYEVLMIGCGIPRITIEGTVEDWQKVAAKIAYLKKYNLAWWTRDLMPIVNQIIKAKQGSFEKQFWRNMVKFHSTKKYGNPVAIDGWVVNFFPFNRDGKRVNRRRVRLIEDLAPEITRTPFVYEFRTQSDVKGTEHRMAFWAGFIGLTQSKTDYTLRPEIGWIINKTQQPTQ